MPVTKSWELFEASYLRPQIADIYGSEIDEIVLKRTTGSVIADLVGKGISDLGPLPTSTVTPAIAQVNYLTPSSVTTGNKFLITIGSTTISYVATASTVANVTAGLTTAINSSTASDIQGKITAADITTRINLTGVTPGVSFDIVTGIDRNTGTGNPVLDNIVFRQAAPAETTVSDMTTINADFEDAYTLIASGVKYFLVADPVIQLRTASGTDIAKDPRLIAVCRGYYDLQAYAYITIHITGIKTSQQFWSDYYKRLETTGGLTPGSSVGNSLADRIALIEASSVETQEADAARIQKAKEARIEEITFELDKKLEVRLSEIAQQLNNQLVVINQESLKKIEQIAVESSNRIREVEAKYYGESQIEEQKRSKELEYLNLKRQFEIEDQQRGVTTLASNALWTPTGQFSTTRIVDYDVAGESTVEVNQLDLDYNYFNLGTGTINAETLDGMPIPVVQYNLFKFTLGASNRVTFRLFVSEDGITYNQFGADVTSTEIFKSYKITQVKFLKLQLACTFVGTKYYVNGNLYR